MEYQWGGNGRLKVRGNNEAQRGSILVFGYPVDNIFHPYPRVNGYRSIYQVS